MLGAGIYPITVAEMQNYTQEADEYFEFEEHERLKTFLALHPESGDIIADTDGVRVLRWPPKRTSKCPPARIIYYFRDLNMPLYMLALYKRGERIPLSTQQKGQIRRMVEELVAEHSERLWNIVVRQWGNSNEPA